MLQVTDFHGLYSHWHITLDQWACENSFSYNCKKVADDQVSTQLGSSPTIYLRLRYIIALKIPMCYAVTHCLSRGLSLWAASKLSLMTVCGKYRETQVRLSDKRRQPKYRVQIRLNLACFIFLVFCRDDGSFCFVMFLIIYFLHIGINLFYCFGAPGFGAW